MHKTQHIVSVAETYQFRLKKHTFLLQWYRKAGHAMKKWIAFILH